MALTFQEHWMFSGSTTVPNVLIQYYRHLQLSADECLLISWLLQRHTEEYFVLNVEETCKTFGLDEKQLLSRNLVDHLALLRFKMYLAGFIRIIIHRKLLLRH